MSIRTRRTTTAAHSNPSTRVRASTRWEFSRRPRFQALALLILSLAGSDALLAASRVVPASPSPPATTAATVPADITPLSPGDVNAALRALQTDRDEPSGVPDIRTLGRTPDNRATRLTSTSPASAGISNGNSAVPRGYRLRETPLDARAREGLALSEAWSQTPSLPAPGPDGRVLYTFGAGLATVVCAPLRLCVIELEPGEHLVSDPQLGDAVRWVVSAVRVGSRTPVGRTRASNANALATTTDLLIVKPKSIGLDTSLLLATDRRAYYLRLLSRADRYMARVAFDYSEERLAEELAALQRTSFTTPVAESPRVALDQLSFAYRWTGRARAITPLRVFDDGEKTYIELKTSLRATELPILRLIGPDGAEELVNYRVLDGPRYVIDRLIERAVLVRGRGTRAERIRIERLLPANTSSSNAPIAETTGTPNATALPSGGTRAIAGEMPWAGAAQAPLRTPAFPNGAPLAPASPATAR